MTAAHAFDWPQEQDSLPPHNIEVEQALLGAILINNDSYLRVASFLLPEHFYDGIHARIYEACAARIREGRVADPKTLKDFLTDQNVALLSSDGKIGEVTPREYLARLAFEATSIINADDYGRTIYDLSVRRRMLEVASDAARLARESTHEASSAELLETIEGLFAELRTSHRIGVASLSPAAAVDEAMDWLGQAYQGKLSGWPWCIPEIEMVMDGPIQPGNLYGLLGASGDGKTSLILHQLRHSASSGVPFFFLSGEQERRQCVLQMASQELGIELPAMLRKEGISEAEANEIFDHGVALSKLPWAIDKWAACTVAQLGVKVRAFVKRYGPGIVAIDHARKVLPDNPRDSLAENVFQVFGGLKDLMGETGCAGILIMQRNSDFLKRKNMAPMRADCYGGEGTLQNLDGCLTLYRPGRWLKEAARRQERDGDRKALEDQAAQKFSLSGSTETVELGTLKNRFGEEGRWKEVKFHPRLTRFISPIQEEQQREPGLV